MIRRSRLITRDYVEPGTLLVCADPSVHPQGTSITEARALLYVCHPSEEQQHRDTLAVAQEHAA